MTAMVVVISLKAHKMKSFRRFGDSGRQSTTTGRLLLVRSERWWFAKLLEILSQIETWNPMSWVNLRRTWRRRGRRRKNPEVFWRRWLCGFWPPSTLPGSSYCRMHQYVSLSLSLWEYVADGAETSSMCMMSDFVLCRVIQFGQFLVQPYQKFLTSPSTSSSSFHWQTWVSNDAFLTISSTIISIMWHAWRFSEQ